MEKSFEGQVLVWDVETQTKVFKSVKCSGKDGYVYRYPTWRKAYDMLESCYPGVIFPTEKRVLEVDEKPNME